jgi:hypothetical protein
MQPLPCVLGDRNRCFQAQAVPSIYSLNARLCAIQVAQRVAVRAQSGIWENATTGTRRHTVASTAIISGMTGLTFDSQTTIKPSTISSRCSMS